MTFEFSKWQKNSYKLARLACTRAEDEKSVSFVFMLIFALFSKLGLTIDDGLTVWLSGSGTVNGMPCQLLYSSQVRCITAAAKPLSGGADVGLLQCLEALLATGTRSSCILAIRATCDGQWQDTRSHGRMSRNPGRPRTKRLHPPPQSQLLRSGCLTSSA